MKTYPYHTPEGIIELVEKLECDKLQDQLYRICKEGFGNDDTIGLEPTDDYVLRKLNELHAANAELIERLRERTESHLAASARDVQTIQRQAIMLERLAGALKAIAWIREIGHRDYSWTGNTAFAALSAYESANPEPGSSPINEANARLIAAAPDLLEALEKCASVIGAPQEGHWATDVEVNDAYDSAVAAIAKAKGEQP